MDRYVIRQREQLKEDLTKLIEKEGPKYFGSEEEFEKKRVLKEAAEQKASGGGDEHGKQQVQETYYDQ